jgi:hypothetical protein
MIVSPPFLPVRDAASDDATWLDSAMVAPPSRLSDTQAPEGSFPLSHNLSWHNGMHLQAPQADGAYLRVRAIADGKVVFAGKPALRTDKLDDPQNYNPFDRPGSTTPAWTDNGCLIIEHRSTIGASGDAETEVVFYSLYMHLSEVGKTKPMGQTVARTWLVGDSIWRKDDVGAPGKVYGHDGQIHFEVCFEAAQLQQLIGRAPNWVEPPVAPATLPAPTADGRTDSVFGSLYFYLPESTPTHAGPQRPASNLRGTDGTTPLGTAQWVRLTYDTGDGLMQSYDAGGKFIAGLPVAVDEEYNLYMEATARHNALPAALQASSSPSGWYELLRFGRNLGRGPAATDKDPLPATAAHWRRIPVAEGAALWADLNAEGTYKFSDADFLPAMGWNCIDDDSVPTDQRCDSGHIKALIRDTNPDNTQRMEPSELARRLGNAAVRKTLRRTICKFPSEWDNAAISTRYGFVKELEPFKADPTAWTRLEAHLQAISFDAMPANYLAADWRMHPREFVEQTRQCGWLSAREFRQLMPLQVVRKTGRGLVWEATPDLSVKGAIAVSQRIPLNLMMRKHSINASAQRMASFFGNALQETQWLTKLHEGNNTERYAPWDGRGFLQLTWPSNYLNYWSYRGRDAQIPASTRVALLHAEQEANRTRSSAALMRVETTIPLPMIAWRADLSGDLSNPDRLVSPAESAGYYWSKLRMASYADERHQLERVASGGAGNPSRPYYRSPSFWRASACVNLPGAIDHLYSATLNGFESRCVPYAQALAVLGEVRFAGASAGSLETFPDGSVPRRGA